MTGTADALTWEVIARRLAPIRDFWFATTGPDGAPHVAPVWGVVESDGVLLFSERGTVKARNLAANPRAVLHPADTADVAIVHGTVLDLGLPSSHPGVLDSFLAKYSEPGDRDYLPLDDEVSNWVLYRFVPDRALLWELADYEASQRRWAASG